MREIEMAKWNAQAPADQVDWIERQYGPEMAAAVRKMRAELDEASRWTIGDYLRLIWNWATIIAGNVAFFYLLYALVQHAKSC